MLKKTLVIIALVLTPFIKHASDGHKNKQTNFLLGSNNP